MKLLSVRILSNNGFRSLAPNELYPFDISSLKKNEISTKVFAGINGSGKSYFLELLSEIFYFLELYHLSSTSEQERAHKNIGFEIEYLISLPKEFVADNYVDAQHDLYMQVRISKLLGEIPEFSIKRLQDDHYPVRIEKDTHYLLPSRVVAYTSGQNELLSNSYHKLKYHYFQNFENISTDFGNDKYRMIFLDSYVNSSVFIANMLLADQHKLTYLYKILQINKLDSFRITINLVDADNKPIKFHDALVNNVEKLKKCATTWVEKRVKKRLFYILDFLIAPSTINAFKFHFSSAFELFKTFYDLEMLNLFLIKPTDRKLMLNVNKSFNFSDDLPQSDPFRLVFRIENIKVLKTMEGKPPKAIPYRALSDGEHQFNEVIGTVLMMEEDNCLFLMDEPDTHFNPKWRAKMVKMLNYVSAVSFDAYDRVTEVRNQEIIITTHSPFVVSDTKKEDVYIFEKNISGAKYHKPEIETYGASINLILQEVFKRDITISDHVYSKLEDLKKDVASSRQEEELDEIRTEVFQFGESIEKFDLYNFLSIKESEIAKQK